MNKNRMFYAIVGLVSILVTAIVVITLFTGFGGNSEASIFPFWFYGVWIPIIARKRREKQLKEEELKRHLEVS